MKSTDIDTFPDDPQQLKALLLDQTHQLTATKKQLKNKDVEIKHLQEQLNIALHHRFGKSSEKHPGQHELFDEPEDMLEASDDLIEEESDMGVEFSILSNHPLIKILRTSHRR